MYKRYINVVSSKTYHVTIPYTKVNLIIHDEDFACLKLCAYYHSKDQSSNMNVSNKRIDIGRNT